jgi:hydrogenase maturation protease
LNFSVARIVVFGYGNPLRGDDGVGWRVAEAVGEEWGGQVLVRTGQQPVPEWVEDLGHADVAYFVDASLVVATPELQLVSTAVDTGPVESHGLNPAQLMGLARAVHGRSPRAFALHVPAVDFDFGDSLSPVAVDGFRAAVRLLDAHIASWTTPKGWSQDHPDRCGPAVTGRASYCETSDVPGGRERDRHCSTTNQ